ncbi:hypothetical protein GTA51_00960 [Desulfovibrio aerotolerans]|uniref:Uncharacterized protein n=1 Tax=Solidesulfovibrio aerotolerans TaxID=295255 RepID=A0A7C9MH97_9BACT|nr:hypothetical protein [Solidesulfovibrio aerotolerans]MYL81709.1 hypothetical protein [Solidesulfovibrio aerotolerans]
MTSTAPPFTPTAWNGLRLTVPSAWRPTRLGLGYMLFEDGAGPAFELKWRQNAGRDGMEAAFRAMTPKGRARRAEALPESWLDRLAAFESMPIAWSTGAHTGLGAALFCPDCGLAAVFQAYGTAAGPSPDRVAEVAAVLASLDHHQPGPPAFAVFGLGYTPPPEFLLASFHFAPGRFNLHFAAGRRRLDILRLAPAEVLLARDHLARLAAQGFGFDADVAAATTPMGRCPAVWLAERQGTGFGQRLLRLCGRPSRLAVLRHDEAADKLLGAAIAAPKPIDPGWLAETAAHCVSL